VLRRLNNSDWKYTTYSIDGIASSKPLSFVRTELQAHLPGSQDHVKLWDFLDESYVAGPDTLPTKALVVFAGSIFASDRVNQDGLCDHLTRRSLPALQMLISRRDFSGAKQISDEANAWIDALKSEPNLAGKSPRLQWYVNVFRRIDAVLNDLSLPYRHPAEVDAIIQQLVHAGRNVKGAADFLRGADERELHAWGVYLEASQELLALNYAAAAATFAEIPRLTKNRKLAELAALGEVRAIFWRATARSIEKEEAIQEIDGVLRASGTHRYVRDINYYMAKLSSSKTEGTQTSKERAQ
jgi:hypothetical protein